MPDIEIIGARENNLKNVHARIPFGRFIVVTGVSGSGKSSLIIDTLYAEGQRRYVESLSSYARQFLMRMNKPDVDYIKGICPAIAIEQKVSSGSSRSTVGSLTEIYSYLKLLYARIGKTISPVSGKEVKRHQVSNVVNFIMDKDDNTPVYITFPIQQREEEKALEILIAKGYSRLILNDSIHTISSLLEDQIKIKQANIQVLVDRLIVNKKQKELPKRIADSVQSAFNDGNGICAVSIIGEKLYTFSNKFEMDGMIFEEASEHLFSFNSPYGACKTCEGFGNIIGISETLVIPNRRLSVYEGAVVCWRGEKMKQWQEKLIKYAGKAGFPIHKAIRDLSEAEYKMLWDGCTYFKGINDFFRFVEENTYKIQYRVLQSRFRGKTICPDCNGNRLRKEAGYVKINGKSITELAQMSIADLLSFFDTLSLSEHEISIASRLVDEIKLRLTFMMDVGLSYLSLKRVSNTLSGGETQRINLTRSLGSNLTSSLYILDEPSIGLHPRDTGKLIKTLQKLRDLGNTVVVIEHDESIMQAADHLIDMGPKAGRNGGEIVDKGTLDEICKRGKSLTAKYLNGSLKIPVPAIRRQPVNHIHLSGVGLHNLKDINVSFPLNCFVLLSGVSGSGKTSLLIQTLYPALKNYLLNGSTNGLTYNELSGDLSQISRVELIDQHPIGRSSRSNPVTYVKAYDIIRELFSVQSLSKVRGFKPKFFSFNVDGGRCENCKGEGETVVEMQFLADVHLTCEDCEGKRFKPEVLEVKYKGKNIFEVLEMTVDEAIGFFDGHKELIKRLKPLQDVGLGYITLGQSSSTLSGGEAQRVKLASFLGHGSNTNPVLFLFDEPTTGLHFQDIQKLLNSFNALIEAGHSIIVIEHNDEVIKSADWVIDIGPDGGLNGGEIVFQGRPEDLINCKESLTGKYLKAKL